LELAKIKLGFTNCKKLAQSKKFEIVIKNKSIALQIDGEPITQNSEKVLKIRKTENVNFLVLKKHNNELIDKNFFEILNWGIEKNVINMEQHQVLQNEYLYRIEEKNFNKIREFKNSDFFINE
jgi:hypothetical protein